jgi:PAS domain S-box-containing protein
MAGVMVGEQAGPARRQFPPEPASVRAARRMIRDSLLAAGRDDLVETAELLVSEIVTNALVHAGTPIEVAFSFVDGGLRVEVADGSPHAPAARGYGPSAGTGRGLMLLEELVDDWGVVAEGPGKTVWFQIARSGDTGDRLPEASPLPRPPGDGVAVRLLDVPLLLHEAWRQHAESLLRELLLANLDVEGASDAIAMHAEASDAVALLAEQIPESGVPDDPAQIMVTATEPLVTSPQVDLVVPPDSVPHFATLERAILAALALVEDGQFLTPPTQPEVQSLRSWLCEQVIAQSEGAEPTPWSAGDEPPPQPAHDLAWDPSEVSRAASAALAADDQDRIVAVGGAAAALLGYAEAQDLLGKRLISIIPARFRQAHLAGFTMHLLSGRDPLLGQTVVVPALRGDGSEVEVALTIHAEGTEDGRTVFVADLAAA